MNENLIVGKNYKNMQMDKSMYLNDFNKYELDKDEFNKNTTKAKSTV